MPRFSIILPTYNRADVLWKAIQSVVDQSYRDWELLVVDDGSEDCTKRLVEEFHDTRIRYISQPNRGPSAARNHGLAHTNAPFVAYLDSDNTWHPNFLERMDRSVNSGPDSDLLWYCGSDVTFWERSPCGDWQLARQWKEPRRQYDLDDVWHLNGADTNCILHRRSLTDTIGGWDADCRWLEDWDFFLRAFLSYPNRVRWVPAVLVNYRQVHGPGADGICAEARESETEELGGRHYLLEKWGDHPDFPEHSKLRATRRALKPVRAKCSNSTLQPEIDA